MTKNFKLNEFIKSQTATRHGYGEQFVPPNAVVVNLISLANDVLEPLRELFDKPIIISSGYRCLRLNRKIGSKDTSQHLKGEAVDFTVNGLTVQEAYDKIKESGIVFDQLIQEYDQWIHISYTKKGNRRECLYVKNVKGKTITQKDFA